MQLNSDEKIDQLSANGFRLIQKTDGTAFAADTVLLVNFCDIPEEQLKIADLGSGSGAISFLLKEKCENFNITGFELLPEMHNLSIRNLSLNSNPPGIEFLCLDVREIPISYPPDSFDMVVSNPPYYKINRGKISPKPFRAHARHEISGTLGDFIQAATHLLKDQGKGIFVLPADRFQEATELLEISGLKNRKFQYVLPREGKKAHLILLETVKSRIPVVSQKLPDLLIRKNSGEFSETMLEIYSKRVIP
ncbi:MAG: methyltransferase [Candidatus Riflebacteria bacterium]|nr:methyltransferase [Candidatus Riflebacteria bacterium]